MRWSEGINAPAMGEEAALSEVHSHRRSSFRRGLYLLRSIIVVSFVAVLGLRSSRAQSQPGLQFDVFLGLDQYARQGAWFPLVCEVKNDGVGFSGFIEATSGSQKRRMPIELPTGTLKRVTLPLFSTANNSQFRIVLRDERGSIRSEHQQQYPRRGFLQSDVPLMAAIPRTAAGMPTFVQGRLSNPDLQASVARLTPELFPDNPITLQSATAIYLNTERAISLRPQQVDALLAWLDGGGHLVIGLDQIGQVNATPWLRDLVNADLVTVRNIAGGRAISEWTGQLTNRWNELDRRAGSGSGQPPRTNTRQPQNFRQAIVEDPSFLTNRLTTIEAKPRDGSIAIQAEGIPLMYQRAHGRGRVSVLTFDPERQPFVGYTSRAGFWTRLVDAPDFLYSGPDNQRYGRQSFDAAIGSLIETTQVRKLSLGWLLLLLIAYAAIIGPFDYVLVRRLKRPMLTWITFPSYVVLFSITIYVIGYKLRAGKLEWNELSIIDVLDGGKQPVWRGKTYGSLYSPQNARYPLAVTNALASLRGESRGYYGNTDASETYGVSQVGNGFAGEITVPIWVSQLCVTDWMKPGSPSFSLTAEPTPTGHRVRVKNLLNRSVGPAVVAVGQRLVRIETLKAGEQITVDVLQSGANKLISSELAGMNQKLVEAAGARSASFDTGNSGDRLTMQQAFPALGFIEELRQNFESHSSFATPDGLNLSPLLRQNYAVVLILDEGARSGPAVPAFVPDQGKIQTVWRMAARVAPAK